MSSSADPLRRLELWRFFSNPMHHISLPIVTIRALLPTALMLTLAACGPKEGDSLQAPQARRAHVALPEEEDQPLDFGGNWADIEGVLGSGATKQAPNARAKLSPNRDRPQAIHALVLSTFPEDFDGALANAYLNQIGTLLPQHRQALHAHVDQNGSMALYGRYAGWDDPTASEDATTLSEIRVNGTRIFGPIIRADIKHARAADDYSDLELISVWTRYPNARDLYALEVELWGDFDSGELPASRRRDRAIQRTGELRRQGIQAYCHHDERRALSTITVGIFSDTAINPQSGIPDPDLARLQQTFPLRLVNGEELHMPVQPGGSAQNVQPIRSRLIKVPRP